MLRVGILKERSEFGFVNCYLQACIAPPDKSLQTSKCPKIGKECPIIVRDLDGSGGNYIRNKLRKLIRWQNGVDMLGAAENSSLRH